MCRGVDLDILAFGIVVGVGVWVDLLVINMVKYILLVIYYLGNWLIILTIAIHIHSHSHTHNRMDSHSHIIFASLVCHSSIYLSTT